jgi:hypothetical protein
MIRLNMLVEGETEETFARDVLGDHLSARKIFPAARSSGGWRSYEAFQRELARWTREDRRPEAWFTTMVDLYALPEDFPGKAESAGLQPRERVRFLEQRWADNFRHPRFIPYLQLHEFEALLLAGPAKAGELFDGRENAVRRLVELRAKFRSPEEINDGKETAPSKRIAALLPAYAKTKRVIGPLWAKRIGLAALRVQCAHFGAWLDKLEALEAGRSAEPAR